jgi:hypothetical protein
VNPKLIFGYQSKEWIRLEHGSSCIVPTKCKVLSSSPTTTKKPFKQTNKQEWIKIVHVETVSSTMSQGRQEDGQCEKEK